MDPKSQQKIISRHGHLVTTRPFSQLAAKGAQSVDDSGPPSPNNGGPVKNFGEVAPGFYRSSFPFAANLDHLRSLGLKTILTLVDTKDESLDKFVLDESITHIRIQVPAHKTPETKIPINTILSVLKVMLDKSNYPLLVHCNKGKHRTGCMVACYRKLHGWTNAAIVTEYRRYAEAKSRDLDEKFFISFNAEAALQILDGSKVRYSPLPAEAAKSMLPSPPPLDIQPATAPTPHPLEVFEVKPVLPTPPASEKDIEDENWPSP